jgi:hypothetical protein
MEASNIEDRYFGISFTTSWTSIHGLKNGIHLMTTQDDRQTARRPSPRE